MAIDEALTETVASGLSGLTLRIYRWRGKWLSLGTSQSINDIDREACANAGVSILRRSSGGTSVLHTHQIGWSLTMPSGHAFAPDDIVQSYKLQSAIALDICRDLGIDARAINIETARKSLSDPLLAIACFGSLAPFEITVGKDDKKLVGWGQVRRRGVVMHHAVMSVRFRPFDLVKLLMTDRLRLTDLLTSRVTDLHSSSPSKITYATVAQSIVNAHRLADVEIRPGILTEHESRSALRIARERFSNNSWTARR